MNAPTLSELLKQLRRGAQLSQTQAAELIGVTQQAISSWENGRDAPGYDHLVRAAEAYRKPLDMLLRASQAQDRRADPRAEAWSLYASICDQMDQLRVKRGRAHVDYMRQVSAELCEQLERHGVSTWLPEPANPDENGTAQRVHDVVHARGALRDHDYTIQIAAPLYAARGDGAYLFALRTCEADWFALSWVHQKAPHILLVPDDVFPVPPGARNVDPLLRRCRLRLVRGGWVFAGVPVQDVVDVFDPEKLGAFWRESLQNRERGNPNPD